MEVAREVERLPPTLKDSRDAIDRPAVDGGDPQVEARPLRRDLAIGQARGRSEPQEGLIARVEQEHRLGPQRAAPKAVELVDLPSSPEGSDRKEARRRRPRRDETQTRQSVGAVGEHAPKLLGPALGSVRRLVDGDACTPSGGSMPEGLRVLTLGEARALAMPDELGRVRLQHERVPRDKRRGAQCDLLRAKVHGARAAALEEAVEAPETIRRAVRQLCRRLVGTVQEDERCAVVGSTIRASRRRGAVASVEGGVCISLADSGRERGGCLRVKHGEEARRLLMLLNEVLGGDHHLMREGNQ